MGKYGKICENLGKYAKIWENMGPITIFFISPMISYVIHAMLRRAEPPMLDFCCHQCKAWWPKWPRSRDAGCPGSNGVRPDHGVLFVKIQSVFFLVAKLKKGRADHLGDDKNTPNYRKGYVLLGLPHDY